MRKKNVVSAACASLSSIGHQPARVSARRCTLPGTVIRDLVCCILLPTNACVYSTFFFLGFFIISRQKRNLLSWLKVIFLKLRQQQQQQLPSPMQLSQVDDSHEDPAARVLSVTVKQHVACLLLSRFHAPKVGPKQRQHGTSPFVRSYAKRPCCC